MKNNLILPESKKVNNSTYFLCFHMLYFSQHCTDFVRRPGETLRQHWPGYRSTPALAPMDLVSVCLYALCVSVNDFIRASRLLMWVKSTTAAAIITASSSMYRQR